MPPEAEIEDSDSTLDEGAEESIDRDETGDSSDDDRGNGERRFSQAEVNALLAEQKRKLRQRQDRGEQPKGNRTAKAGGKRQDEARDDVSLRLLRLDFRDALEDRGIAVPRKQRQLLERTLEAMAPGDVDEFIDDFVMPLLGNSAEGERRHDQTTQTEGAKGETPSGEGAMQTRDRGGARAVRDFDEIDNPNDLTATDIQLLQRKHGKPKANRMIREMAENYYKGKAIPLRQPR